jgi:CBS domain containing-hemolysin-like protein
MIVIGIKIILYLLFMLMLAFFAGTETALTSLSTVSLSTLKSAFPRRKKHFTYWEDKPNEILATLLVGTNLALVATGVVSTSLAIDIAVRFVVRQPLTLVVVTVVSILGTLILGDIIPKIFSRYRAENVAVFGLPFLVRLAKILSSFNRFLLRICERILGMFGQRATKEKPFMQPDELKVLLLSDETLPLSSPARTMMKNIIDFGKTRISHVMIPRERIQAVNLDQEPQKIIEQIIEKEYSRVPVYRENLDNIVGIIYSKDLALAWRGESLFLIDDLIRPAYFVPDSARIDQVLREFKRGHQHLALVVDEFGSVIGLATIEDLMEEIVGEIWDEYDIQETTILPSPDGGFLVRAGEPLAKLSGELGINLPISDFSTVSGWVLDLFGRIPKIGDVIRWGNLEIEIVDADKKRVLRIKIIKLADGGSSENRGSRG